MQASTVERPESSLATPTASAPNGPRLPLAEALDILVFTYDRAERLRATLEALLHSPFARCRITILDNCSPDHTPAVCAEYAERFERFRIVRHSRNIGLGPNYLRAVELSEARYSWILSDDEDLDFSACQDIVDAIEAGEVDLLSLGSPGQQDWERGLRTSTRELLARGQRFFFVWTFAAGVIFRTELFDSRSVGAGYLHLQGDYAHYPHFEFIYKCLREDCSVYVSREVIAARKPEPPRTQASAVAWLIQIMYYTSLIQEPDLHREGVRQVAASPLEWCRLFAFSLAFDRLNHPTRLWRQFAELIAILPREQRVLLLLTSPAGMVPRSVYAAARSAVRSARWVGSRVPRWRGARGAARV